MKPGWPGLVLLVSLLACSPEQPSHPLAAGAGEAGDAEARETVDFTLGDLNGMSANLSDHRGKTVVVDFWATWCPPCLFQVPELNKLRAAHAETGDLAVIGVSVDIEGAAVVGPWVEEQGVEYTILLGDEQLAREFGVVGFPTLAVVRPDGSVHSLHVGLVEHDELEELVAAAQAL
ncbi:MAG: TlpA family protein disulfide reductase [Deltaproteobacteria bacterium]|nr:TlpA family protein disulfide reductase [Deltaproteobacteria bacterium]MBW2360298.1 TlpA family protein disulfide reductase [Deltaproteobacteria bacterium]